MNTLSIDDSAPLPLHSPASPAEIAELVREASAANQGVYPVGGRTALDLGLPPAKPGVAMDTTAMNRVIDYPARDMTITVQAGITLAELERTLAAEHQWLPIDVPNPERATLGGAIAVNASGPRRLGYGTLRDYIIGISFIADDGTEVKAGGRVVKNVAGYDLMKLHVGALGTLGIVTQVTLKVKPKPETSEILHFECDRSALSTALDRLHASHSRPVLVEVASVGERWAITLGFEEKRDTAKWQVETLRRELQAEPFLRLATKPAPPSASGAFTWKANVRPSRTAEFCNAAVTLVPGMAIEAHGLTGIVRGSTGDRLTLDATSTMVKTLAMLAADGGGNLVITRCPTAWKTSLPIWGRPSPDRDLMRTVKQTLDPRNIFNPGRLFGDI